MASYQHSSWPLWVWQGKKKTKGKTLEEVSKTFTDRGYKTEWKREIKPARRRQGENGQVERLTK